MKKLLGIILVIIVMASCGGGDFATVGEKVDPDKYQAGSNGAIIDKNGKIGIAKNNQIVVPTLFDELKILDKSADDKLYFRAVKDGKQGIVKEFEKKYVAPCEYEKTDATPALNLLYLQKPGENMETYCLDTGEKWEGTDKWPPKKFPADVSFKVLSDLRNWKVESIICLGRADKPGHFAFKLKGVGLKDSRSRNFTFYAEEEGTTKMNSSLASAYFFPDVKQGEPFEFDFVGLWDSYFQNIKFAGFLISE